MLDGERIDSLPPIASAQSRALPVYETLEGWSSPTGGVRTLNGLPAAAVAYVRRLEELVDVPIALLSTGPDREDTIQMATV
jgi:adenylosuccinate synthase